MTDATPRPSADEVRAALETLVSAWSPGGADVRSDADEVYDEDAEAYAEGEDPFSVHTRHKRTERCDLPGCELRSQYRVRGWCVRRNGVYREASAGDPAAVAGSVHLGDNVQWHMPLYACTTQHARELMLRDSTSRGLRYDPRDVLSPAHTHYEVLRWEYRPDDYDVPGALHPLMEELASARYWVRQVVQARYALRPDGLTDQLWRTALWRVAAALSLVRTYEQDVVAEAEEVAVDLAVEEAKEERTRMGVD